MIIDRVGNEFTYQIVLAVFSIGILLVGIFSALEMMRARLRIERESKRLLRENADLRSAVERSEMLLDAEDQVVLSWEHANAMPILIGSLGPAAAAPKTATGFLCFETWLTPTSAAELSRCIDLLCDNARPFTIDLNTVTNTFVEACGRTGGWRPFVRFRDLTAERIEFAKTRDRMRTLSSEVSLLRRLLDHLPWPAWKRNTSNQLECVNTSYASYVEADSAENAVQRQSELLNPTELKRIKRYRDDKQAFTDQIAAVVEGKKRLFEVVEVSSEAGSAGIAMDLSKISRAENEVKHVMEFHARTLDQLTTAVAIFDAEKKLRFYNAAYLALWQLEPSFLKDNPEDGTILEELRATRRLPEQSDWREWKRSMLKSYVEQEPCEHWWHLPDGQTLRVIANPHPQGGVAYVYENMTRTLELEAQNKALTWVQRETLDHLSEGVSVFGSDGRLRLWNPRFVEMWSLDEALLQKNPHVTEVMRQCAKRHPDPDLWAELKFAVTGLSDTRQSIAMRMERLDSLILDVRTVPLPDGGTLISLVDVTDTVNVERALTEKNAALEASDRIKTDFVSLVSYELRSPLTSIAGFAHLISHPLTGVLNEKQREYIGYVMSSANSLMTIIDDVLDLATIEAGTMRLHREDMDIALAISVTIASLRDRIAWDRVEVSTNIQPGIGTIWADPQRLRQVLFNLLAHVLRSANDGATISVSAWKERQELILVVSGGGYGLSSEEVKRIFETRYAMEQGARFRIDGLGLSLVRSFVELHGGSIAVSSDGRRGTTFTCRLPFVAVSDEKSTSSLQRAVAR